MDGLSEEYKASVAAMRKARDNVKTSALDNELKTLQEAIDRATKERKDIVHLPIGSLSHSTLAKIVKDFTISYGIRLIDGRVVETSGDKATLICLKLK